MSDHREAVAERNFKLDEIVALLTMLLIRVC